MDIPGLLYNYHALWAFWHTIANSYFCLPGAAVTDTIIKHLPQFIIHLSQFTIHLSRFIIYLSRFTVHLSLYQAPIPVCHTLIAVYRTLIALSSTYPSLSYTYRGLSYTYRGLPCSRSRHDSSGLLGRCGPDSVTPGAAVTPLPSTGLRSPVM